MANKTAEERSRKIIHTSIIGIFVNFILVVFKAIVGYMSGSIAIVLDAVNNFSDSISSIVTIVGVKVASRAPDKEHPMGHGRSEYLSTAAVAVVISYIGLTALVESIQKIIHPNEVDYTSATFIIVIVSIIAKIMLGLYYRKVAKNVDSDTLKSSGTDALFDSVISLSTLVAAIIFIFTGVSIEAYLAAIISGVIIYSGFNMLREAFSVIMGERIDSDLSKNIKQTICEVEGVQGAYDLVIHDYGAASAIASVNIGVIDTMDAAKIDDISREVRRKIGKKYHVLIASVGVYPINTKNKHIEEIREHIESVLMMNDHVKQMHGFHVDEKMKEISFDVVLDFEIEDYHAFKRKLIKNLKNIYQDYSFNIIIDQDYSD